MSILDADYSFTDDDKRCGRFIKSNKTVTFLSYFYLNKYIKCISSFKKNIRWIVLL